MSRALNQLAEDLCQKGCAEIAWSLPDALWLARLLPGASTSDLELVPSDKPAVDGDTQGAPREIAPRDDIPADISNERTSATPPPLRIETFDVEVPELRPDRLPIGVLVPRGHQGGQPAGRGPKIEIPAPPSLPDPHEFGRRLKPLRRFRRNTRKPILDVTQTVQRICDEKIWDLVVRYPYDRCLHLTWIIDGGGSMDLWRQIGSELFVAYRDSGVFLSCQAHLWDVDSQWQYAFTPLDSSANKPTAAPRTSWPAAGLDRLFVVFSDCSSGRWTRPETLQELQTIGRTAQILVVNPLPERMWGRTALGRGTEVDLRSPTPAAPACRLQICPLGAPDQSDLDDRFLKLPAITIDRDHLLGWSRFVAGQRPVYPGFCLDPSGHAAPARQESDTSAEQRLSHFRGYASRGGRELARLVSAVPLITPRFIRLVRERMMPPEFAQTERYEAELLLSPLLHEVQEHEQDGERVYDFYAGVRERLLQQTPTDHVQRIFLKFVALDVTRDLIRPATLGEYGAMIPRPDDPDADCTVHHLSEAPTELILQRLGGQYRRFLEEARSSGLRLELNSHLRSAEKARASGDLSGAQDAIEQALALAHSDPRRWGEAWPLLDEQLHFYRGLLRLAELVTAAKAAREPFIEGTTGMVLAPIPAGRFLMGSPESERERIEDEQPHWVRLSHDFWMAIHPVTQGQYRSVMGENPSESQGLQRPVENVSWENAVAFCEELTRRVDASGLLPEGYVFRLPTEAEWEYCCRAGTTTATAFGDSLSSTQANFDGNYPYGDAKKGPYLNQTSDVGSYEPNAWGLFDMHGNVWEWCLDYANLDGVQIKTDTYVDEMIDPLCQVGRSRVYRGGSWDFVGRDCRSAFRFAREPGDRYGNLGFRVCLARSPAGAET